MTATLAPWVARWIGLPFRLLGRGPDAYDCWGLVCAIYVDQVGIALPSFDDRYAGLPADWGVRRAVMAGLLAGPGRDDWRPLGQDEAIGALDGVLMRRGADLCHVGLVVGVDHRGRATILHTEEGAESHLAEADGPALAHHIDSYWRHRALDGATGRGAAADGRAAA